MESRSQDELDNWNRKLVISSNVAGVKKERIGGVKAGYVNRSGGRVSL